jgi:CRP/FNR family transcriptional regulator, anaerobic regulatory protein
MNAIRPMLRTLKAGETLYFQGDECRNIYVLLDGWALRHRSLEDGRRQILDFALPGVVFCLTAKAVAMHGVEALTPCTFSVFSRDRLFELFHDVPALSLGVVELMADAEAPSSI